MTRRSEVISRSEEFDVRFHVQNAAGMTYRLVADPSFDQALREAMQDAAALMETACRRAFSVEDPVEARRLLSMTRGKAGRLRGAVHLAGDLGRITETDHDTLHLLLLRLSDRLHDLIERLREFDPDAEPPLDLSDLDQFSDP